MVSWMDTGAFLDAARQEAEALLRAHWTAVEALALALLKQRTMQRDEILAALRPHLDQVRSKALGT